MDAYLAAVDVPGAVRDLLARSQAMGGLRGAYLEGVARSLGIMWELAQEQLGRGPAVPYARCVQSSCGRAPEPSRPEEKRRRLAELLARAGHPSGTPAELLEAVDAWRAERLVPRKSVRQLGDAFIAQLEEGTRRHVVPHLPASLHDVPRANVRSCPSRTPGSPAP